MGVSGSVGPYSVTSAALQLSGRDVSLTLSRTDGSDFRLDIPAFDLAPGSRLALTGENGSGKTTALSLLGLVRMPAQAEAFQARLDEHDIDLRPPWRGRRRKTITSLRRACIGVVQHAGKEAPFLTVRERIWLRLALARSGNKAGRLERVAGEMGLGDLLGRKPAALSQGQRQRLALACAIAISPALIVADEPTAALDREWAGRALGALGALADFGSIVIIATHEPEAAREHGFKVVSTRMRADGNGTRSVLDLAQGTS